MRRSERLRVTLEKYGFGFRAVGVTLTIVGILIVIGLGVLIFKGVGGDIMNVFGKMFGDDTKQEEDMDYVSIEEVEARLLEIGEMSTALYEYEGVITESDCDELFDYDLPWTRYFVELEYEGEIRAGYEIKDIDVTVDDDEMIIYIELPEPEVFSNEITDRDLEWSDGLFNEVDPDIEIELTEEVKEEELEAAIDAGLFERAETSAQNTIRGMLAIYTDYEVVFGPPPTPAPNTNSDANPKK